MTRGKFIVFEGGGGSGKDTLINLLKEKLRSRADVVYTRAPGGTPIGEHIRELLLSNEAEDMHPRTELLLFLAAHAELVERVITPALAEGKLVISNRFVPSVIAYQIYGRKQQGELMIVREALRFITRGVIPDVCVFLDASPEIAIKRAERRTEKPHRFVKEDLAFQTRVREGYKKHIAEFARKTITIDSSGTPEETWKKAEVALESFL